MNIFEGIEDVSAEGTSRQYFEPGKYTVAIDRVFVHEKRLGGRLFIVESTIQESDNSNIRPGEQRNWVQSLGNEYALPRIKSFIGAALGLCPRRRRKEIDIQVTKSVCEQVISEKNPLNGKVISIECMNKAKRDGKMFVHAVWGVVNG